MSTQWQSAPQAPPGAYSSGASGPRAGFWIRFGAVILDALIVSIPALILIFLVALISTSLAVVFYVLWVVALIAYPIYFEGGPTGATFGKRIVGIKVIDFNTGGSIGYGRAFLRYIVKSFLSGIFLLGYLWMLWDKEKQTWHDKLSNSVVVPADAYR